MRNRIGLIVPDDDIHKFAAEILTKYVSVDIQVGLVSDAVLIAKKMIYNGCEIIIARAEVARTLKKHFPLLPVVELPISPLDLIRSVESIRKYGDNFAIICFENMVYDLEWMGVLLGVTLKTYMLKTENDVESTVQTALLAGCKGIIGGGVTIKYAKTTGIPCVIISISKESIMLAIRHATQVIAAIMVTQEKNLLITTVLENTYEGVITTDNEGVIRTINPSAQVLTGISESSAVNCHLSTVIQDLKLEDLNKNSLMLADQILDVAGKKMVCNIVPIVNENVSLGTVVTFKEAGKIVKTEENIRRKLFAKGHVAKFRFETIIGESDEIKTAIETAKNFSSSNLNILILGETGTGKEVFAQSIHNHTERCCGPFVAINCASLPGEMLESELFGYVSGAFTGASKEGKPGLFEVAHGGTVFLDEIGELDYLNQGRLLRFIQERTVRRLGSDKNIPVDVRIIAATNKDLEHAVLNKSFREDLYYRLNVLTLYLPPFREREGDINMLLKYFFSKHKANYEFDYYFSDEELSLLNEKEWRGNAREIENFVARKVFSSTQPQRHSHHKLTSLDKLREKSSRDKKLALINDALLKSGGNYSSAAEILKINRTTLWRWIRETK
ncbi:MULTISPECIES: sigma 54-interacting transcriptional regulator [unclassified Raoultella]|nr:MULTISPECIES: sigma 54-interacting transcriptional regulator [unclassified Raoultella]